VAEKKHRKNKEDWQNLVNRSLTYHNNTYILLLVRKPILPQKS
jgi:hypothetical protein